MPDYVHSKQRMQELSTISAHSIYNQVYHLQKPDYARDVTEASQKSFVMVLLTSSLGTNTQSALLVSIWRELASRFGDVKFCQIRADLCIEGYPERNTPTILIYKDGDIKRQLVTLKEMQGEKTTVQDFEKMLLDLGAVKHNDARLQHRGNLADASKSNGSKKATVVNNLADEDSDWE